MWRSLLKGINWFPESYGEDEDEDKGENKERMDKLVKFVVAKGSSEMKREVLREVASRFFLTTGINYYSCAQKGGRCGVRGQFKVTVSIEGWGEEAPSTFEIGGGQLSHLHNVALVVGAEFTIKKVKTFGNLHPSDRRGFETFKLIWRLVDQQNGGLDKLELQSTSFDESPSQAIFLSLVRACKEWKVLGKLFTGTYFDWTELARSAATGHIRTLMILNVREVIQKTRKEDLKAVWEITEKLELVGNGGDLRGYFGAGIAMGGGREEDPKTTWEDFMNKAKSWSQVMR